MDRPKSEDLESGLVGGGVRAAASGPRDVDDLLPLTLSRPMGRHWPGRVRCWPGSPGHMTPRWPIRPRRSCCASSAMSRPRSVSCARRYARPAGPARPSARPMCWPAWAWRSSTPAGPTAGLAALRPAVRQSTGVLTARVLVRRGIVLITLGRYPAALDDLRRAVSVLRRAGDQLWTARALNARANAYRPLGLTSRADADLRCRGRSVLRDRAGTGSALSRCTTGRWSAFASGDLPAALSYLDAADRRLPALKVATANLRVSRCDGAAGGRAGRRRPGRGERRGA